MRGAGPEKMLYVKYLRDLLAEVLSGQLRSGKRPGPETTVWELSPQGGD